MSVLFFDRLQGLHIKYESERFAGGDVFVDYPFEEVKFRWDYREGKIFRKFYGESEDIEPVPHDKRWFNDARGLATRSIRENMSTGKRQDRLRWRAGQSGAALAGQAA